MESNLKASFNTQMHAELKVLQIITNKHTQKRIQYIHSTDLKEIKMPSVEFIFQYLRKLADKLVKHV